MKKNLIFGLTAAFILLLTGCVSPARPTSSDSVPNEGTVDVTEPIDNESSMDSVLGEESETIETIKSVGNDYDYNSEIHVDDPNSIEVEANEGDGLSMSFTNDYIYGNFLIYSSSLMSGGTYTLAREGTSVLSWTQSSSSVTIS